MGIIHGKWLQRRTKKELPRTAAEKSLSFGKLQRNSRAEALPGLPMPAKRWSDGPSDGAGGAQPQHGAVGDGEGPGGLCPGSCRCLRCAGVAPASVESRRPEPAIANPLCLLTCSAHRFIPRADAYCLPSTRLWRAVMDEPTGLPPLARLSSPSSAAGPTAPRSSGTRAAAGPQRERGAREPQHQPSPTPAAAVRVPGSPLQRREAAGWPFKAFFFFFPPSLVKRCLGGELPI